MPTKDSVIRLRVLSGDKKNWEEAASSQGITLSAWLYHAAQQTYDVEQVEQPQVPANTGVKRPVI